MGGPNVFQELKSVCVPLLAQSVVDKANVSSTLSLLEALTQKLDELKSQKVELSAASLAYVFYPLSQILARNESDTIPDQLLERLFNVLDLLFHWWWWTCDDRIWDQVLMLAGSVVGGLGAKPRGRERDDETKDAAVKLILTLLGERKDNANDSYSGHDRLREERSAKLHDRARSPKLTAVFGMTYDALLTNATSSNLSLQIHALQAAHLIGSDYFSDEIVASVLPGTVSTATKVALGRTSASSSRGWQKGDSVAAALALMDIAIIRAIGDDICISTGLVKDLTNLDDLVELVSEDATDATRKSKPDTRRPYEIERSSSWMKATASQLLIALNSLSSLLRHPTASALFGLSALSHSLLAHARLTLPDTQPLLLSYLLTLSLSSFPSVSAHASTSLSQLLNTSSKGSNALLQTLVKQTTDNLSFLPNLLTARSDTRLIHAAGQIEAVCRLSSAEATVGIGVGQLLGPAGHVEKWGWRLLAVLNFAPPAPMVLDAKGILGLLESSSVVDEITFPSVILSHVSTREAHDAVERMLRALGSAAGVNGLVTVEWFVKAGTSGRGNSDSVAALWCAIKILEGISGVTLDGPNQHSQANSNSSNAWTSNRKMAKLARWLSRTISEIWDNVESDLTDPENSERTETLDVDPEHDNLAIEFAEKDKIQTRFDLRTMSTYSSAFNQSSSRPPTQPILHKSFALHLIALASRILQSRFSLTLMHTLYPLLHSIIQPSSHLSGTAHAALQHITTATGFASPANLLLANFDYALDSVSRRLTKRNLDVDAANVLGVLVRLVGKDVVNRAGDVVEECFDRLDEFHGYTVVVEGIVGALLEVVKVVGVEEGGVDDSVQDEGGPLIREDSLSDSQRFREFIDWLDERKLPPPEVDKEDFGPNPREAFGKSKENSEEDGPRKSADNELGASALAEPPLTPTQTLLSLLLSRSLTLLTHPSSLIRTRILTLLSVAASSTLLSSRPSAILPQVHRCWPFVLNRLKERDGAVLGAAAGLVEALVTTQGDFMNRRVWEDVWPIFRSLLAELEQADETSALARRNNAGFATIGTESRHTHSHRLYLAMMRTMTAAISGGANLVEKVSWDVLLSFRRFLSSKAHEELQEAARTLYITIATGGRKDDKVFGGNGNPDAVWLVLWSTAGREGGLEHLHAPKWDVGENVDKILAITDRIDEEDGVQQ